MKHHELLELLETPEHAGLDFKEYYWKNTCDLVHDILCMANSSASEPRYIIFGVEDKTHKKLGLQNDSGRKNLQNITNTLRNAYLTDIPPMQMETVKTGELEIDFLEIYNGSSRPYYLLKDFPFNGNKQCLRRGIIYSRNNDENTPKDSCASPARTEQLWRERFGIGIPPLEQFSSLVREQSSWRSLSNNWNTIYHHQRKPEFTIEVNYNEPVVESFREAWTDRFPDKSATSYFVNVKYHTTVLDRKLFVSCDGARYFVPAPERYSEESYLSKKSKFFYEEQSLSYAIWRLFLYMSGYKSDADIGLNIDTFLMCSKIEIK